MINREYLTIVAPLLESLEDAIYHQDFALRQPPAKKLKHVVRSGLPVRDTPKINRNAPCPCGSGLKFKKCCDK